MCRGLRKNEYCTLLGADPARWSRTTPLPKPTGSDAQLDPLIEAWDALERGDVAAARNLARQRGDDALRDWYIEHAQVAGGSRHRALGQPAAPAARPITTAKRFDPFLPEILMRDGYRCRYCGDRVAPRQFFRRFQTECGAEAFSIGRTNATRPGVFFTACASLDHVVPYALGGPTSPENLVTTCWACNYGKWNYTLEQIGLDSPFDRPPAVDSAWVDLMERARKWRPC